MSDLGSVSIPYGTQGALGKGKTRQQKAIRITLKLPETNEDTYPEYNYKDELSAFEKRTAKKSENGENGLDAFEDDSDVRRIAQEMEEKYGKSVVVNRKKRRGKKDDYADIGMGYDESDSFIDNTDGYDEIIPHNVSTRFGGFYINCGALEFKTDNDVSMDEDSSSSSSSGGATPPRHKKRILQTSDEESGDGDKNAVKKPKTDNGPANGMQKAIKKKLFSQAKIQKVKKRRVLLNNSTPVKKTVKDLLKAKRTDLDMSVASITSEAVTGENVGEIPVNVSSVTDVIESVIKATDDKGLGIISTPKSSQNADESNSVIKLPENLPNNIVEVIDRFRNLSKSVVGLKDIFSDEINSHLLSLEKKCKCLGKPSRLKIYEHLAFYLNVDKSVVQQQCSKLTQLDEDKKINILLKKLKKEIDQAMPAILINFEKECERRMSLSQLEKEEGGKGSGKPKRKFQWNDQIRKLLKDTASIKKRSFMSECKSKELLEAEMIMFLKNRVLGLWPEGWMTIVNLTKAVNSLCSIKHQPTSNNNANLKTGSTSSSTASNNAKKDSKITAQTAPSIAATAIFSLPPDVTVNEVPRSASLKTNNNNALDVIPVYDKSKPEVQIYSDHNKIDKGHHKVNKEHYKVDKEHFKVDKEHYKIDKEHHKVDKDLSKVDKEHFRVDKEHPLKVGKEHYHRVDKEHSDVDKEHLPKVNKPHHHKVDKEHLKVDKEHFKFDKEHLLKFDKEHHHKADNEHLKKTDKEHLKVDKEHLKVDTEHFKVDKEHFKDIEQFKSNKEHLKVDKEHYKVDKGSYKVGKEHQKIDKEHHKPDKEHYNLDKEHLKKDKVSSAEFEVTNNNANNTFIKVEYDKLTNTSKTTTKVYEPYSEPNEPEDIDKIREFVNQIKNEVANHKTDLPVGDKPLDDSKSIIVHLGSSSSSSSSFSSVSSSPTKEDYNRIASDSNEKSDDIMNVMQHLKQLQKMSSPVKSIDIDSSSSSSAFPNLYSSKPQTVQPLVKPQRPTSVLKNIDAIVNSSGVKGAASASAATVVSGGYQDEFQKQFMSFMGHAAPSKSNSKCS